MKAEISELWNTGRDILNVETISQLRKCENVLVGERLGKNVYECLIDENIVLLFFVTMSHPATGDKIKICEVN